MIDSIPFRAQLITSKYSCTQYRCRTQTCFLIHWPWIFILQLLKSLVCQVFYILRGKNINKEQFFILNVITSIKRIIRNLISVILELFYISFSELQNFWWDYVLIIVKFISWFAFGDVLSVYCVLWLFLIYYVLFFSLLVWVWCIGKHPLRKDRSYFAKNKSFMI